MRTKFYIAAVVLTLFSFSVMRATIEIKGTVRSAAAGSATIAIEGEFAPNIGDPMEVFFKLPGADTEISVGSGNVSAVKADVIEAKIDKATGTVSKDQLARMTSAKPKAQRHLTSYCVAICCRPAHSLPAAPGEKQISPTGGRNPSFAFVNMNKLFQQHPKTKGAEAKINKDKTAAKNEYDQHDNEYRKLLDQINDLNRQTDGPRTSAKAELESDRDDKVTEIKKMEKEINDFRTAREKELQEQAVKLREGIVAKITPALKACAEREGFNLVFDSSGNSLNGVPIVVLTHDLPDLTDNALR
jgi:outer membrane protein